MPHVKAQDGTELYYYDWGTGAPVILIHGWPQWLAVRRLRLRHPRR
jgi:pimeloyl-ACP methyl ester carboxylesterase